ncbi:hypothetical protein GYMLUDRAFT_416023 [Collybiopsis luxurians FD-317 M1]|nr:hypothetical protein GYMLUDRAFT_416023 [Collybiopsis luxurians FD-317 M1]
MMCKFNFLFSKPVPSTLLPTFYYHVRPCPHLYAHLSSFDLNVRLFPSFPKPKLSTPSSSPPSSARSPSSFPLTPSALTI